MPKSLLEVVVLTRQNRNKGFPYEGFTSKKGEFSEALATRLLVHKPSFLCNCFYSSLGAAVDMPLPRSLLALQLAGVAVLGPLLVAGGDRVVELVAGELVVGEFVAGGLAVELDVVLAEALDPLHVSWDAVFLFLFCQLLLPAMRLLTLQNYLQVLLGRQSPRFGSTTSIEYPN
jgi:hypothetical protein